MSILPPNDVTADIIYGPGTDPHHNIVKITWNDTNAGQASYRVEFAGHNQNNWQAISSVDTGVGAKKADHAIDASYKYDYRVSAVSGADISSPSATVSPTVVQDTALTLDVALTASGAGYQATVHWGGGPGASGFSVQRRIYGDSWSSPASLSSTSTSWSDPVTIASDEVVEYQLTRNGAPGTSTRALVSPARHASSSRGTALLVVDETVAATLERELGVLESDLVGDGWKVKLITVPRDDDDVAARHDVGTVKSLIQANNDGNLKSIILVGHVPVPYSGSKSAGAADQFHSNHLGAHNADMYYGDLVVASTDWTEERSYSHQDRIDDIKAQYPFLSDSELEADAAHYIQGDNRSKYDTAGPDGKFDQDMLASGDVIEVPVGRVDFANLDWPEIAGLRAEKEVALLRRYFEKNHRYRMGLAEVAHSALFDQHLNRPALDWQAMSPVVGTNNLVAEDWKSGLTAVGGHLFAFGMGGGWAYGPAQALGVVANTSYNQPASPAYHGVFNFLRASYGMDWDLNPIDPSTGNRSSQSLVKSMLASKGDSLTATSGIVGVAGTAYPWMVERMSLGGTIGDMILDTQNEVRFTYISLLGDPTLRMDVVKPVTNVTAKPAGASVSVSWTADASEQTGVTYRLYRAQSTGTTAFGQLNWEMLQSGLTGTTYTDSSSALSAGAYIYMVRAEKLQQAATGGYYNLSQGMFGVAVRGTTGNDSITINGTQKSGIAAPGMVGVYAGSSTAGTRLVWMSLANLKSVVIGGGAGDDSVALLSNVGGSGEGVGKLGISFDGGGNGVDTFYVNGNSGVAGKLDFNIGNYSGSASATVNVRDAVVVFVTSQHLGKLKISDGHGAMLAARAEAPAVTHARVLYVDGLDLGAAGAETGTLDLMDNDLVVDYAGTVSPFARIFAYVWDGYSDVLDSTRVGIVSTSGQNAHNTILALWDNGYGYSAGASEYPFVGGDPISLKSIIGKYTYFGDFDVNGMVTADDYGAIDSNLGETVDPRDAWLRGDADFNGVITPDDYGGVDSNLGLGEGNPL
jgi:hypothetical protein